MIYRTVAEYMEGCSCSIERDQPLRSAQDLMHQLEIRHLPVRAAGRLCGVLSERDVHLAWNLRTREDLSVREVMSEDFYPVMPTTPLVHVVRTMGTHGYQAALVVENQAVKGIFTSAHALRAMSDVLEPQAAEREGMGAGEVRAVILTEHLHVSALLERTHASAKGVLETEAPEPAVHGLRGRAEHLLLAMKSHIELEDRALAPALADLPGYGKERGAQLMAEHRRQTSETEAIVRELARRNTPPAVLARRLDELVAALEDDLAHEEELLLNLDLLRDDGIVTECTAG